MGVGTLSASDANKSVSRFVKNSITLRMPKPLAVVEALRQQRVHVFGVGPWAKESRMSTWGTFMLPACPADKEYVEFLMPNLDGEPDAIPAIMAQEYRIDEVQGAWHQEDGREWANKLLMIDIGIPPYMHYTNYGFFVAKGEKPTKEELRTAVTALHNTCRKLVNDAREMFADPKRRNDIQGDVHGVAARTLNLNDEPWMVASNPLGRQKCPICGSFSDPDVVKCGNCREFVFDPVAYKKILDMQKVG